MSKRITNWLMLGLLCGACIKREPGVATGGESAASGSTGSTALATVPRTPVLGTTGVREFKVNGEAAKVDVSVVPVSGQPFSEALRAQIKEASNSEYTVQVQARISAPVEKGDLLLATFWARSVTPQEAGKTETAFVFERAEGPYTKSITYPIYLGPDWRKIQIRFASVESYAAGQAQMIFRLGYEPEAFEIAGMTVENFGKQVKLLQLPTSEVADLRAHPKPVRESLPDPVEGGVLSFEVDPGKVITKISPYVYGLNSQNIGATRTTVRRMGGNRGSAYNWETNASNAGHDYKHQSDEWSCEVLGYRNCKEPAGQYTSFVLQNNKAGAESIVTIPIIDYVAADKDGPVSEQDKAPSKRWARSLPKKKGPYVLEPDLRDGTVYEDEFVNYLVQKLGRADKNGTMFYSLDNEPALWPSTHPRVHPDRTSYKEIIARTEATASSIVNIDPSAVVLGGVMFGWSEFMSLSSAPDAKEFAKHPTYIDYFLSSLKELEQKHGKRLVHVLDLHWYPEVRGTQRITENDTSRKTIAARLEAPRSFWDPTYKEKSWIGDQWGKPIRLFPWLKERVAALYPGTKLSLTEYNFGTGDHISGGLAQIDVLGILGREGVYLANYWGNGAGVGDLPKYIGPAFQIYRNYDGKGGEFGDTALETKADLVKSSAYAATRSQDGRLTVLVINKDLAANVTGTIKIAGAKKYAWATPYVLDSSGPTIKALPKVAIKNNVISHKLPRLSATIFVVE
jgi:hypothetical protein